MFNLKKISIVVVVIILAFIAYSYFISGSKSQSASGVSKQAVSNTSTASSGSAALDGPGKDFVMQLLAIQNIKFNLDLFNDPVFLGLQNYHKDLDSQEAGRPNPFAPLDGDTSGASANGSFPGFGMTTDTNGTADASTVGADGTAGANTAPSNTTTQTSGTKTKAPVKPAVKK